MTSGEPRAEARTPQLADLARPVIAPGAAWWRGSAIGAGALALALGALAAIWLLARPLALLFAAIVLAEAAAPVVGPLERRLPRAVAVVLVYILLVLAIVGLGWVVVPRLAGQAQDLATDGPSLVERFRILADRWDPTGGDRVVEALRASVDRFSRALLALPLTIFSSVVQFLLVLFMSMYWLIAAPALRRFALSLLSPGRCDQAGTVLGEMGRTMGGYVRAVVINGVLVAVIDYAGYRTIGVDYPLVLALLGGVGELVPVVGPILAAVPAVAIALLDSPAKALVVLAFIVVVQQLESNLLVPVVMRRQADIPPLLSLFALFAGSAVGGLLGALVAVPLAAALRVVVLRVAVPAVRRWTGAGGQSEATGAGIS